MKLLPDLRKYNIINNKIIKFIILLLIFVVYAGIV